MKLLLRWKIWKWEHFGYPKNVSGGYSQILTPGKIEACYTNWFKFSGDISGGMSGGSVMLKNENKIIGVTSQSYNLGNYGRAWRMTNNVILLIIDIRNGTVT